MHSRVPRLLALSLCLACAVLLPFVSGGGTVHAAADPTVVVVRDATPAGCTQRYSTLVGTSFVSTRTVPCPAGTIGEDVQVPLSEAKARYEAYVVLPSRTSSLAVQTQAGLQIQQLENAAKAKWHPANKSVTPASSCSTNSHSVETYWSTWWDTDTTFDAWVFWDTHSDCTIYIWESQMHAVYINSYFYWGHDQYASWSGNVGCRQVTNGYPWWNPNVTKNPGYTYEQHVYSGSNCTIFDHHGWTDSPALH